MKAVSQLNVDFARVVPMETSEGDAVIELNAAVSNVQSIDGGGKALTEILSQGKIEGRVTGQIIAGIRLAGEGIGESGAIVDVG
jgi:hypothetical protein